MKILNKYKRAKKLKNLKKKYRGIYLTFLVIISLILNNYNIALKENKVNEEEMLSFYLETKPYYVSSDEKAYIYVGDDTDEEIKEKVTSSATEKINGDYLELYSWDLFLGKYFLVRLDLSNYNVIDNTITLDKKTTYDEFINSINTNATSKIYKDEEEITDGNISSGMTLKIYYKGDEIDSYNIIVDIKEYADFSKLNIKNDMIIINELSKVENLINQIDTNGNIKVLDKDNKILDNKDNLKTCSKLQIEFSQEIDEYTIVIIGDVTGSGNIFIGDISKLHQYFMNKLEMDSCYIAAGDVTKDDKIDISDISKLYQYFMGTIDSLQ